MQSPLDGVSSIEGDEPHRTVSSIEGDEPHRTVSIPRRPRRRFDLGAVLLRRDAARELDRLLDVDPYPDVDVIYPHVTLRAAS
jgi:hypothetical protein